MMLDPFIKNTLGELMLANIVQAAQNVELQQQLQTAIADKEKLAAELAGLKTDQGDA